MDTYTHGHQDAVLRSHRWRTVDNSAAYLVPHLVAGTRLLDVGCGPGSLTIDLARRVAPGEVIGIDLAASVVAEASRAATDAGLANVTFRTGDFAEMEADPGATGFDIVHAHQVLQHLSDPVAALRHFARLTRPGGIIAARDGDYPAMIWAPATPELDRWRHIYMAVTRRNGAEAGAGRWLLTWAHAAGFDTVTYSTSTWTFADGPSRRWWGGLWADRCLASTFAEQAVAYGIAARAELEDIAAGWRQWSDDRDAVFVVPHGEVLIKV